MLAELHAAVDALEVNKTVRCLVLGISLTDTFSMGGNPSDTLAATTSEALEKRESCRRLLNRLETLPMPVVSAVQGRCEAMGAAFAWVCDIRLAADTAVFRVDDLYSGSSPSSSTGMVRLVHYIGRNRTMDIMLLGEEFTAREGQSLGVVSKVLPSSDFDAHTREIAMRLASAAPLPVNALKRAVNAQWRDTPDRAALHEQFRESDRYQGRDGLDRDQGLEPEP